VQQIRLQTKTGISETLERIHHTTRPDIPKDCNLIIHGHGGQRSTFLGGELLYGAVEAWIGCLERRTGGQQLKEKQERMPMAADVEK
jgi:hypothetical protein